MRAQGENVKYKRSVVVGFSAIIIMLSLGAFSLRAAQEPVVLEFGVFAGSIYDVPNWQSYRAIDETIDKFEKTHPNIKVKYRSGTLKKDYSEWLAAGILKGSEPDVFCVLSGDFDTFAAIKVMQNLDDFIVADSRFDKGRLYSNALRAGQLQGAQFALPKELNPELMFVNKLLLKKEGIEVPKGDWTWQEFYEICRKVTKDTDGDGKIDQFGVVGFTWQDAVYTNGQQLFDARGTTAMFDKPEVLEAVKFIISLNRLNQNFKVTPEDFDNGKVAFRPFPFSSYRAYKSYPYRVIRYTGFDWECIKLPRGPHGNNAAQLNSFLIGMSARSKHKQEAWELIKFLTYNKDIQMDVFRYSHGVPVIREVTESNAADEELRRYNPEEQIAVDTKLLSDVIDQSIVTPRFHKYDEAMNMADKEIFQIVNGGKNPEVSLQTFNQEENRFLMQ
jgi:multiple sugar transport system substrate-binding protein